MPRSTHRYFVDNFLSSGLPSLKASLLSCYEKFHHGVGVSTSLEVRVVASLVSQDIRSITGSNVYGIRKLCNLDPLTRTSPSVVKEMLLNARTDIPDQDSWRIPCLKSFLERRHQLQVSFLDTKVRKTIPLFCAIYIQNGLVSTVLISDELIITN